MIRRCMVGVALVVLIGQCALGDVLSHGAKFSLDPEFSPPETGGQAALIFGMPTSDDDRVETAGLDADSVDIHYSTFTPPETDEILTFLKSELDTDKDGFVDSPIVAEANPTGYVVFHFRSRWLNERIRLGGMLDSDMMVSGYRADPDRLRFGDDDDEDPDLADPEVPEPSMIAISVLSLTVLVRRRRKAWRRRAPAA